MRNFYFQFVIFCTGAYISGHPPHGVCPQAVLIPQITDDEVRNFVDSTDLFSRLCACPSAEPIAVADMIESALIAYGVILKSQPDMTFTQAVAQKKAVEAKKNILYQAIFHNSPEKFTQLVNMGVCDEPQS